MITIIQKRTLFALLLGVLIAGDAFAQYGPPTPPLPPSGRLLDFWPFSGTNYLSVRGSAPVSITNVALLPTWAGNGLQVDSTNAAWITYAVVETNGMTNLNCLQGTIEMWFSPDWNSYDGLDAWGTILEVGNWNTNISEASGASGLYISPDSSGIYFSAQANGLMTNYLNAPISWNAGDWHHIALTYSATNSALYLEGQLAASGAGVSIVPPQSVLTNGISIGADSATGLLQARGVFNYLRTYNYELNADTIAADYADDSQFVYPLPFSGFMTFSGDDLPSPPGGTSGTGGGSGGSSFNSPQYSTNDFWVEPAGIDTNGMLTLLVHGTTNNATNEPLYQIWCTTDLNPPVNWNVIQTFLGSTNTNITVLTVPIFADVPTAFFEAINLGTNASTADSSLPAWYLLQNGLDPTSTYTGTNLASNPYVDPMGDGWSYLSLFRNNMNPHVLHAPPAPVGFTAKFYTNGTVRLSWPPASDLPRTGAGSVAGYTISLWDPSLDTTNKIALGRTVTNYTYVSSTNAWSLTSLINSNVQFYYPTYSASLQVNYENTNSLWTPVQTASPYPFDFYVARGPEGRFKLLVSSLPSNIQAIRVIETEQYLAGEPYATGWDDQDSTYFPVKNYNLFFDISASSVSNGVYNLSDSEAPLYSLCEFYALAIGNDGSIGPLMYDPVLWHATLPYVDGTEHMRQNLNFVAQSASVNIPFSIIFYDPILNFYRNQLTYPQNYVFDGFYSGGNLDEFEPFQNNYLFRNFLFVTTNDLSANGALNTSVTNSFLYPAGEPPQPVEQVTYDGLKYYFDAAAFQANSETNPPATMLDSWQWNSPTIGYGYGDSLSEIGLDNTTNTPPQYFLEVNSTNLYGLAFQSVALAYENTNNQRIIATIASNSAVSANLTNGAFFYPGTVSPQWQYVTHYFGRPYANYSAGEYPLSSDPLPGDPAFGVSDKTPPIMITGIGQTFELSAWAKLSFANGNTNKFGYIEQYFDKAYLTDANGNITTNQTGILSEYGEFFPTDPGMVLLTTKSNADAPCATNPVYVIGLFTDANHDGTIDTRWSGPDSTTPNRPFRFWMNDDNDSGDTGGNDIPGQPAETGKVPNGMSGKINGVRDLVDFFPVYIDVRSLVEAIPHDQIGNYQFVLSQADGAINFVNTAIDPGEPLSYLTDTNVAFSYSNANVIQITSNGIPLRPFGTGIILCEASAPTSNPLVLSIYDANTNLLAQTSLYLSITGVEQMFRHKNLIVATYGLSDGPPDRLSDADVPNEPDTEDKNLVFLHGYNVNPDRARGAFAETFKRMFWSGSHAKFYGVTWLGNDTENLAHGLVTPDYHINVVHAFQTAPELTAFLATLTNGPTTVVAHSLGNMVVLSALNDWNAPISNYFMLDAAVAIEAIDTNALPTLHMVHSTWLNPEAYSTRLYASYWSKLFSTNDSRSDLTWSNRLGNFQNAQVYNFYSSGEEVLREYDDDPPLSSVGIAQLLVDYYAESPPASAYVWVWQEKGKGVGPSDLVLGSTEGGWKFNKNAPYYYVTNGTLTHMPNSQASLLPASQLQTNAFFDESYNTNLFNAGLGGLTAMDESNNIIADMIPAMTLPIGANPVSRLAPEDGDDLNFDMQLTCENGWPLIRPKRQVGVSAPGEWHHSDFKDVAYTYTYKLFTNFVTIGNLK